MSLHKMLQQLLLLSTILKTVAITAYEVAQSKPGCPNKCGNVTIPYPFGLRNGCYLDEAYFINCTQVSGAPKIGNKTSFDVLDVSINGQLRVSLPMACTCYDEQGQKIKNKSSEPIVYLSRFPIATQNKLTALGCDTRADMKGPSGDQDYITGCVSMSGKCEKAMNESCLGMGCSQVTVPYRVNEFRIHTQSNVGMQGKWRFNNCSYAFIAEEGQYKFRTPDMIDMPVNRHFGVMLQWTVGNSTCEEAQKDNRTYLCHENSSCYDVVNVQGYRCNCSEGFMGNPYLPNGCQDINECEEGENECIHECINTQGSYKCLCPEGQEGDGRKNGTRCSQIKLNQHTPYVGISMGIAFSVVLTSIVYFGYRRREMNKCREKFFKKNGGMILQKLLFEYKDSTQVAKIFTAREMETSTNSFNKSNIIGQGGYGTVYKGTLANGTMIAIKKSKTIAMEGGQVELFINEVIMLSQISHPNVVKLLGCCLETPTPLLVYEFINNKTLYHHLHEQDPMSTSSMTLEVRLNIATQTAQALAHMHMKMQIVHRDIKSSNILLSDDYTAKVSDFGISRFIPMDETHLSTLVHGTLGYIDPEYFRSGILTEKSDVYSFGIVLIELLTGKKVFSSDSDFGLAADFVLSLENGSWIHMLDHQVKRNGLDKQIKRIAELAKRCVELEGKQRPNIKEVKDELMKIKELLTQEFPTP